MNNYFFLCSTNHLFILLLFLTNSTDTKTNIMKLVTRSQENNLYLLRILFNQMPQKLIAQQMGISQSFYCKLEKGVQPVSRDMITRLSSVYQTDIADIIFLPKYELWRRLLLEKPLKQFSLAHQVEMEAFQMRRKFAVLK